MGWLDIVVIGVIVISAIIGLSKGLFESILAIFGTALSLFIAIWASKPVASFVNGIVDLNSFLATQLTEWGVASGGNVSIIGLSFTVEKAAEYLAIILAGVAVWIAIKIVIWLLARLFDSAVSSSSALSGMNRLLGLVFGTAKGALMVAIVFVLTALVSQVAFSTQINNLINDPSSNNSTSKFIYSYVKPWTEEQLQDYLTSLIGDPND